MLESIRGLSDWCHMDCRAIYKLWRRRIVKQDESDGDPKFTTTIGLGGKLTNYWRTNIWKSWKWRGVWRAYKNPILEFDVGQISSKNKKKTYKAQVIFTTIGGMVWSMD